MTNIILDNPVTFVGLTVSELNFKTPIARDMRKLPVSPKYGDMLDFGGTLCDKPPEFMDLLTAPDVEQVMQLVLSFFSRGQKTGPKPLAT